MTHSSSRRSVVSAGLAFFWLTALACSRVDDDGSPWLVTTSAGDSEAVAAATRAAAFWVMADSLSPAARERFVSTFDDVLAAAEATFDPLGLELGEDLDEAVRAFETFLPQFNAAFAISAPSWPLPGERLRVRVASEKPADDRARRAWGKESDEWARRLRFAAWPVSDSAQLRASSAAEYEQLLAKLRERACTPRSAIGVIVTPETQKTFANVSQRRALLELSARARRLAKAAEKKHRVLDLALSPIDVAEPARVAPWLRLRPLECLIVPRLAAPGRRKALGQALEELLIGTRVVTVGGGAPEKKR